MRVAHERQGDEAASAQPRRAPRARAGSARPSPRRLGAGALRPRARPRRQQRRHDEARGCGRARGPPSQPTHTGANHARSRPRASAPSSAVARSASSSSAGQEQPDPDDRPRAAANAVEAPPYVVSNVALPATSPPTRATERMHEHDEPEQPTAALAATDRRAAAHRLRLSSSATVSRDCGQHGSRGAVTPCLPR